LDWQELNIPDNTQVSSFCNYSSLELVDFSRYKITINGERFFSSMPNLHTINWGTRGISLKSVKTWFNPTCPNLTKMLGWVDVSAITPYLSTMPETLRRCEMRGLGTAASFTTTNDLTRTMAAWGAPDPDGTDPDGNLQSMIDTLLTYSFDRAAAGYSACTIVLHANAKARLTDEQKAAITAKGYTIS
jgi:hypothetical protein